MREAKLLRTEAAVVLTQHVAQKACPLNLAVFLSMSSMKTNEASTIHEAFVVGNSYILFVLITPLYFGTEQTI